MLFVREAPSVPEAESEAQVDRREALALGGLRCPQPTFGGAARTVYYIIFNLLILK